MPPTRTPIRLNTPTTDGVSIDATSVNDPDGNPVLRESVGIAGEYYGEEAWARAARPADGDFAIGAWLMPADAANLQAIADSVAALVPQITDHGIVLDVAGTALSSSTYGSSSTVAAGTKGHLTASVDLEWASGSNVESYAMRLEANFSGLGWAPISSSRASDPTDYGINHTFTGDSSSPVHDALLTDRHVGAVGGVRVRVLIVGTGASGDRARSKVSEV